MKTVKLLLIVTALLFNACSASDDAPRNQLSAAERACKDRGGWCQYGDLACGKTAECICRDGGPEDCSQFPFTAVCGCDGQVYDNVCLAWQQGTDTQSAWSCSEPVNSTPCGWVRCNAQNQACLEFWTDRPEPSAYQCQDIADCSTCDCVQLEAGCTCSMVDGRPFIEGHALL